MGLVRLSEEQTVVHWSSLSVPGWKSFHSSKINTVVCSGTLTLVTLCETTKIRQKAAELVTPKTPATSVLQREPCSLNLKEIQSVG